MATTEAISIDPTDRTVRIKELTIHDEDLVSFLEGYEPGERDHAVEQALVNGARMLEFAETSKDLELVKSEFKALQDAFEDEIDEFEGELEEVNDELESKLGDEGELAKALKRHFGEDGALERRIERAFGEDGAFAKRLDAELGEDGERITAALDPGKEGSPTHRLKQRLVEEIREVKEALDKEEGRDEIRQESWHKGDDFEDQIEALLEGIVGQTSNTVENTSTSTGELQGSKKGDFVVTLGDTGQRIVVEAKHGQFGTIEEEMEEAIDNRDADFGILVAQSIEYLPRTKVGWFSEIDQQYVVVALSGADDEEIDPRLFQFAFNWARTRAMLTAYETDDELDPEALKTELDGIEDEIGKFSTIRRQCTNIEDAREAIEENLDVVQSEVEERLRRLQAQVTASAE